MNHTEDMDVWIEWLTIGFDIHWEGKTNKETIKWANFKTTEAMELCQPKLNTTKQELKPQADLI